jgi:hypothetical protein
VQLERLNVKRKNLKAPRIHDRADGQMQFPELTHHRRLFLPRRAFAASFAAVRQSAARLVQ